MLPLLLLTASLLELEKQQQLTPFLDEHFGTCLEVCETTMLTAAAQQEPIVQLFLQFHTIQPPPPLLQVAIASLEKLADEFYSGLLLDEGQQSASGLVALLVAQRDDDEKCRKIAANNLFQLLTANASESEVNGQLFINSPITIGHNHDATLRDNLHFTQRICDTIGKFNKITSLSESERQRGLETFDHLLTTNRALHHRRIS